MKTLKKLFRGTGVAIGATAVWGLVMYSLHLAGYINNVIFWGLAPVWGSFLFGVVMSVATIVYYNRIDKK